MKNIRCALKKIMNCIKPQLRAFSVFILTAALLMTSVFTFNAKALERILDDQNPEDMIFTMIHNPNLGWVSTSNHLRTGNTFHVEDNCETVWYYDDDCTFWYKKYSFNYGNTAVMTLETTITETQFVQLDNGTAGILLRTSLDPGATCLQFHIRNTRVPIIRRLIDNGECSGTSGMGLRQSGDFPMKLKIELTRTNAKCSYQLPNQSTWTVAGSEPFNHKGIIYAGLNTHSSFDGTKFQSTTFEGFSVQIDAPEGSVYVDPEEGDGSGGSGTEEEIVKLPPDLPVPADSDGKTDYLMRETFTDGQLSLRKKPNYNTLPVLLPFWKTGALYLDELIKLNEDNTNRFLNLDFEKTWLTTGDQHWTDYSAEFDVNFSSTIRETEIPVFAAMVRFTDIVQYGYKAYVVRFTGGNINTVSIGRLYGGADMTVTPENFTGGSVPFNFHNRDADKGPVYLDSWHKIRIEAFNNTIAVYCDGELLIKYTDPTEEKFLGRGGIGFYTNNISVMLDNITVRKMNDYIGGDFDNAIGGNFGERIPDYARDFLKRYSINRYNTN